MIQDDIIENYLQNILKKQLKKFQVSNKAIYDVVKNVRIQMKSLLSHWKEPEFRDAILIIGSEEGTFYEPKNELIAKLVVVTIRNSLLEGIASVAYEQYNTLKMLKDEEVRIITAAAIEYFSQFELDKLEINIPIDEDYYKIITDKYPVALKALMELAKCTEENLEHDYIKKENIEVYELEELEDIHYFEQTENKIVTESGIEVKINKTLCNFLKGIKEKKSKILVFDSFKMLTRNFEKLLRILEFTLTHDAYFLTCNYFIASDYVSRRSKLIKASHHQNEFLLKIKKISQISKKYEKFLKQYEG